MNDICENHHMQRYEMDCADDDWFVLNKTRESNINTITDLLKVFYEAYDNVLQSDAETFYNDAFGE